MRLTYTSITDATKEILRTLFAALVDGSYGTAPMLPCI